MVRIGISVEGTTEERFIKQVLAPYLAAKLIFVVPISMGGDVKLDRVKNELKCMAASFDYVTTFYDFYGFKGKLTKDTQATLEGRIKQYVHESIQDKLIPYVQMYEFEAILFSCPETMQSILKFHSGKNTVQEWALEVLEQFDGQPEKINDSPQTAPSKRLEANTNYRKTSHGPDIAKHIGIDKIRQFCPGFNGWLQALEATTLHKIGF